MDNDDDNDDDVDDDDDDDTNDGDPEVAGDQRVNEQPGLASLHTVWLREHNRLAAALESLNTDWDQEKVFQEARRILTAQWQHVVYSEWLPVLLGPDLVTRLNLGPRTSGYSNTYNQDIDPRISNEFAAAAFRLGEREVLLDIIPTGSVTA